MTRLPQVAVIGGNETMCTRFDIEIAEKVGEILVDSNCRIFNGGFGGVMKATCVGARKSKNYKNVRLNMNLNQYITGGCHLIHQTNAS